MQGKSAGLKCGDFGVGQKCRVMCQVQECGVTMLRNWPGVFLPNDGERMVMLAITGYCAKSLSLHDTQILYFPFLMHRVNNYVMITL